MDTPSTEDPRRLTDSLLVFALPAVVAVPVSGWVVSLTWSAEEGSGVIFGAAIALGASLFFAMLFSMLGMIFVRAYRPNLQLDYRSRDFTGHRSANARLLAQLQKWTRIACMVYPVVCVVRGVATGIWCCGRAVDSLGMLVGGLGFGYLYGGLLLPLVFHNAAGGATAPPQEGPEGGSWPTQHDDTPDSSTSSESGDGGGGDSGGGGDGGGGGGGD